MSKSVSERVDEALRLTGRLVALVLIAGVGFFALGVALKPVFPDGLPPGADGRQIYIALLVVSFSVAQVAMVALADKGDWTLTGLGAPGWSPLAILGGLAIGLGVPALGTVAGHVASGTARDLAWTWPASAAFMTVLVRSMLESLLLRGYPIGLFAAAWGDAIAVALTALGATLVVLQGEAPSPALAIDAFALATCLGILRLRTGSLVAAWLAQLAAELVRAGLGSPPVPGVTAGLLLVVSFLLFRMRPATDGP